MSKFYVVSGKEMIRFLKWLGFELIRINGSHHRMKAPDGRKTTIPVHANKELPLGLLRKIIRDDLNFEIDEFNSLFEKFNKVN